MSLENLVIGIGVLVLLSPFSGLPFTWLQFILPVLGLLLSIIGYALRRQHTVTTPSASIVSA